MTAKEKTATYLLLNEDLTKVLDRMEVPYSTRYMRQEPEVKWLDQLKAGCTIWSCTDTGPKDLEKAEAERDRRLRESGRMN